MIDFSYVAEFDRCSSSKELFGIEWNEYRSTLIDEPNNRAALYCSGQRITSSAVQLRVKTA